MEILLEPNVTVQYDSDEGTGGTFMFEGETHTLGNALRQTINSNPQVEFCGYAVPHPAEQKMTLRIQTSSDTNIVDVMNLGLSNFQQWCEETRNSFSAAFNTSEFSNAIDDFKQAYPEAFPDSN